MDGGRGGRVGVQQKEGVGVRGVDAIANFCRTGIRRRRRAGAAGLEAAMEGRGAVPVGVAGGVAVGVEEGAEDGRGRVQRGGDRQGCQTE